MSTVLSFTRQGLDSFGEDLVVPLLLQRRSSRGTGGAGCFADDNSSDTQAVVDLNASLNALTSPASDFSFLRHLIRLDVSHNRLTTLEGLLPPRLRFLNVSANQLASLAGIEHLQLLDTLLCSQNRVASLTRLVSAASPNVPSPLLLPASLRILDASYNCITSLRGVERCAGMAVLRLEANSLATLRAVQPVAALSALGVLAVAGNPVAAAVAALLHGRQRPAASGADENVVVATFAKALARIAEVDVVSKSFGQQQQLDAANDDPLSAKWGDRNNDARAINNHRITNATTINNNSSVVSFRHDGSDLVTDAAAPTSSSSPAPFGALSPMSPRTPPPPQQQQQHPRSSLNVATATGGARLAALDMDVSVATASPAGTPTPTSTAQQAESTPPPKKIVAKVGVASTTTATASPAPPSSSPAPPTPSWATPTAADSSFGYVVLGRDAVTLAAWPEPDLSMQTTLSAIARQKSSSIRTQRRPSFGGGAAGRSASIAAAASTSSSRRLSLASSPLRRPGSASAGAAERTRRPLSSSLVSSRRGSGAATSAAPAPASSSPPPTPVAAAPPKAAPIAAAPPAIQLPSSAAASTPDATEHFGAICSALTDANVILRRVSGPQHFVAATARQHETQQALRRQPACSEASSSANFIMLGSDLLVQATKLPNNRRPARSKSANAATPAAALPSSPSSSPTRRRVHTVGAGGEVFLPVSAPSASSQLGGTNNNTGKPRIPDAVAVAALAQTALRSEDEAGQRRLEAEAQARADAAERQRRDEAAAAQKIRSDLDAARSENAELLRRVDELAGAAARQKAQVADQRKRRLEQQQRLFGTSSSSASSSRMARSVSSSSAAAAAAAGSTNVFQTSVRSTMLPRPTPTSPRAAPGAATTARRASSSVSFARQTDFSAAAGVNARRRGAAAAATSAAIDAATATMAPATTAPAQQPQQQQPPTRNAAANVFTVATAATQPLGVTRARIQMKVNDAIARMAAANAAVFAAAPQMSSSSYVDPVVANSLLEHDDHGVHHHQRWVDEQRQQRQQNQQQQRQQQQHPSNGVDGAKVLAAAPAPDVIARQRAAAQREPAVIAAETARATAKLRAELDERHRAAVAAAAAGQSTRSLRRSSVSARGVISSAAAARRSSSSSAALSARK
jgi:hypothetical protein